MRVVRVSEVGVAFSMKERRQLYRIWKDADRASGFDGHGGVSAMADLQLQRMFGFALRELAL